MHPRKNKTNTKNKRRIQKGLTIFFAIAFLLILVMPANIALAETRVPTASEMAAAEKEGFAQKSKASFDVLVSAQNLFNFTKNKTLILIAGIKDGASNAFGAFGSMGKKARSAGLSAEISGATEPKRSEGFIASVREAGSRIVFYAGKSANAVGGAGRSIADVSAKIGGGAGDALAGTKELGVKIGQSVQNFAGDFGYSVKNLGKNLTRAGKAAAGGASHAFSKLPRALSRMGEGVPGIGEKVGDFGQGFGQGAEAASRGVGKIASNIGGELAALSRGLASAPLAIADGVKINSESVGAFGREMVVFGKGVSAGPIAMGKSAQEIALNVGKFAGILGNEMAALSQGVSAGPIAMVKGAGTAVSGAARGLAFTFGGVKNISIAAFSGAKDLNGQLGNLRGAVPSPAVALDKLQSAGKDAEKSIASLKSGITFDGLGKAIKRVPVVIYGLAVKAGHSFAKIGETASSVSSVLSRAASKIAMAAGSVPGVAVEQGKQIIILAQNTVQNSVKSTGRFFVGMKTKASNTTVDIFNRRNPALKTEHGEGAAVPRSEAKASATGVSSVKKMFVPPPLKIRGGEGGVMLALGDSAQQIPQNLGAGVGAITSGITGVLGGFGKGISELGGSVTGLPSSIAGGAANLGKKAANLGKSATAAGQEIGASLGEIFIEGPQTIAKSTANGILSLGERLKKLAESAKLALQGRKVAVEVGTPKTGAPEVAPSAPPVIARSEATRQSQQIIIREIVKEQSASVSAPSTAPSSKSLTIEGLTVNSNALFKGSQVKITSPLFLENNFIIDAVFSIDATTGNLVSAGDITASGKLSGKDLTAKGKVDFSGAMVDFSGAKVTGLAVSGGTTVNNYYYSSSSGGGGSIAAQYDGLNINGDGTIKGGFTVSGGAFLNGGATIGDASSDTLTINASTVSIPNGITFSNGAVSFGSGASATSTFGGNISVNGTGTSTLLYGVTLATSGGNVGIGTASPAYLLDVNGIMRTSGVFTPSGGISTSTLDNVVIGGSTRAAGSFTTLDANSTLNVTGLSTFGKTSSTLASIFNTLYVGGTSTSTLTGSALSIGTTAATSTLTVYNSSGPWLTIGNGTASTTIGGYSATATSTNPYGIVLATSGGNVGIGTVSPAYLLDVNGTLRTSGVFFPDRGISTSTLDNVVIGGSTPAAGYFTRSSSTLSSVYQGLFIGTTATTSIYGQTTSTFGAGLATLGQLSATGSGTSTISYGIVLATSGGNVGIGTAGPAYLLDVNGTMRISGVIYPDRGISTSTLNSVIIGGSTPSAGYFTNSSSTLLSVFNTLYVGGTSTSTLTGSALSIGTTAATSTLTVYNSSGPWLTIGNGSASTTILGGVNVTSTFPYGLVLATSGGNVGIGTASPQSALHINKGIGSLATGIVFGDGDTGIYENSDDLLSFNVSSDDKFFLTAGGQFYGPYGVALMGKTLASVTVPNIIPNNNDLNTGIGYGGSDILSLIAGGTSGLNIASGGKVGIGTITPSSTLEIYSSSGPWLTIGNGTASTTIGGYSATATSTNPYGIVLATSGGNVGIGTASPAYLLDVNGTLRTSGVFFPDRGISTSTLDNVVIGGSTNALGRFTTLVASTTLAIGTSGTVDATSTIYHGLELGNRTGYTRGVFNVDTLGNINASGTLIVGGFSTSTFDGLTIGGSTRAAGNFTNLNFNGTGVLGDNGDDIAIDSNDWDISSAGVASNLSITTSTLDGVIIGRSTAAEGKFTAVTSTVGFFGSGGATTGTLAVAGSSAWLTIGNGTASTTIGGYSATATSTNPYGIVLATSGGNVGIGTASPAYLLDVNGTLRTSGVFFPDRGISTSTWDNTSLGLVTPGKVSSTLLSVMNTLYIGGVNTTTLTTGNRGLATSTFYSDISIINRDLLLGGAANTGNLWFGDGTVTSTLLSGNRGLVTSTLYSDLSIVNRDVLIGGNANTGWLYITDGTATTSIRGGTAGSTTSTFAGDVSIPNLYTGLITFSEDGGMVDAMDMGVSASAASSTDEGYGFLVDGLPVMSVKGSADAAGSANDLRIELTNNQGTATTTIRGYAGSTSTFAGNVQVNGEFAVTGNCTEVGGPCVDIAEQYASVDAVEAGDVIISFVGDPNSYSSAGSVPEVGSPVVSPYNASLVEKSKFAYAANVVGVVSTNPGLVLGENSVRMGGGGAGGPNSPNVALAGRVPVKVTDENGIIRKGDFLVTSEKEPGRAMKFVATSTPAGFVNIFAMALEDWNPSIATTSINPGVMLNKITVLVRNALVYNSGNSFGSALSVKESGADIAASDEYFDFSGKSLVNIKSLASAAGTWSLSEEGEFIGKSVKAKVITLNELIVAGEAETAADGTVLDPAVGDSFIDNDEHVRVVYNNRVKKNSQIFITFRDNTGGPWWISNQGDGFFEVSVPAAMGYNIRFSYWVVGVEGGEKDPMNPKGYDGVTQDATAPEITAVAAVNITDSGATVNWSTNEDSDSSVVFTTSTGANLPSCNQGGSAQQGDGGCSSANSGSLTSSHSLNLSNLTPQATYYYIVKSTDAAGNVSESQEFSFTTAGSSSSGVPTSDSSVPSAEVGTPIVPASDDSSPSSSSTPASSDTSSSTTTPAGT